MEENKKRMEQLNLHKLAQSLKASSSPAKSPKPSPVKRLKGRSEQVSPVRRSSRMADKPLPNYKEDALEPLRGGKRVYSYQRRDLLNRVYASSEERQYTIDQAEKLESNLGSELPCCIKPMLQSHVTGGFWLSLPLPFCKENLPDHDEWVTLVDEEGNESETKYLATKNGLSGGWRGFAIDHELVDGDCLIFQLIRPNTLKVYIIRVNSPEDEEEESHDENHEDVKDAELNGRAGKEGHDENHEDAKDGELNRRRSTRKTRADKEGLDENHEDAEDAKLSGRKSSRKTRAGKR